MKNCLFHHPVFCQYFCRGITLVELLTTLAIISLVTSLSIPSMGRWIQNKTEATVFRSLFHLSVYTRNEAIKSSDFFTLCPTSDQKSCNGQWNNEIMVFNDSNKNELLDNEETLHKLFALPANTPCIEWNSSRPNYLQFKPSGASNGTPGHFRFCESVASTSNRKIVISLNGRTSIKNL